ncbi:TPA: hypothetical protein ACSVO5_003301 [Clostridioides difficile]
MIGLKKRDIKKALKAGGMSLADVRADIEDAIDEAMNSTDPEVQANFKRYFGNGITIISTLLLGVNIAYMLLGICG